MKRTSNNEATPQKKQKLQESYEDDLASRQTNDEHIANEKHTASDSDSFTDIVNVNKLRNLIHNTDEPEKVLANLLKPRFGFVERLKRGSYRTELTELLLEVIAVACKSKESDLLTTFLNHINGSKFLRENIALYLNRYLTGQESINIEVFSRITAILRRLVTVFPSRSLDIVTLLFAPIQYLQQSTSADTSFYELYQELHWAAKHRLLGVPTRDTEEEEFLSVNEGNFKFISLAPTCEDIKGKGDPYLRKNKVFTRYADVNDYLDVQFRLLREDLIRPLREGLAELLESRKEGTDKKRKNLMKVYQKVQIVSWRCSPNGIIYKIHFDTSRLKRVRWGAGKRLIFGSIVCLSADQFQTMFIGTIAERNVQDLCNGIVFVSFENENSQVNSVQFNCYYEMIESPAYYEPYKNVLGVLQYLDEKSLPFQRYLLNHGHDDAPPPKYITSSSMFDFSCVIKPVDKTFIEKEEELLLKEKQVLILKPISWPSAEQLGLDDSQYSALKAALTKEFSVIQGPPGTGKTFIGVLIVQLLLANKYIIRPVGCFRNPFANILRNREPSWDGPILIVCYTNHALDQFLEEIIKRHPDKVCSNQIVRIGSRCSSENESLKRCMLSQIMHRSNRFNLRLDIRRTKGRIRYIEDNLTCSAAFIELTREELLHEDVLKNFMFHGQFEMLTRAKGCEPSVLLRWLYDRRSNAWQSDVLRDDAENAGIQDDADCYEDQWDEQVGRQSDFDNTKPSTDFRDCKEKMRKQAFLNLSQDDIYFKSWQSLRKIHQRFHEKKPFNEAYVWTLSLCNRWRLYNYWISLCNDDKLMKMETFQQDYSREKTQLDNTLNNEHCDILAKAEIVAMTTTVAAKSNKLLKTVKPKIVIVEEAAEVLEAHIVASLTEECQQLILIGDHQQLRPKPADDRLAKHYWLHVSLFERMLLNRMNCECLAIQHRMRPEISKLLVPHIYKSLRDHSNVHEYENIAGVMGNLFFLNHSVEENSVDDMKSHSNEHEASVLAAFCKYLLNVGYSPDKITVLTLYTGQLFLLRKYFPKKDFEGVRITPVDNFQGEENDIILLSLVRSNKKNDIGFLSIPNRVCVALSRARKGLFIIGNGDLLRDASPLWRDILDTLKSEGRLVEKLPLGCRKHQDNVFYVSCAADFSEVPAYGCKYPCEYRLGCGHACERKCHEMDPGHEKYKCMKPCQRKPKRCRSDHSCLKECHLDCGYCPIPVQRTLARCQHTVMMECHKDENNYRCMEPCKKLCSAGHKCKNPCYYEHCICTEPVKRRLVRCQHEVFIPCSENERLNARIQLFKKSSDIPDEESIMKTEAFYYCHEPCKKSLACGHPCGKQCYEACNNDTCLVMTEKILPHCQHKAVMACNKSVYVYQCQNKCEKTCQADHQCIRLCSEACGNCEELVVKTLPFCSHKAKVPCCLDPLQYRCELACEKLCLANHRCVKKCGEQCGNCTVQVEKTLPKCHHKTKIECHENPEDVICLKPCEKILSCDHQCQEICGASRCSQFCTILVDRTLPCEHIVELPCFEDATSYPCCEPVEVKTCEDGHTKMIDCNRRHETLMECMTPLKLTCSTKFPNHDFTIPCHALKNTSTPIIGCPNTCNVELDCGHLCQQKCEDCASSGKHPVCRDTCNKQFPLCLHKCQRRCGSPCDPCSELWTANSRCSHVLSDAINMCHKTFKLCYERCKWSCPHYICDLACWKPCDRQPCNRACGKLLHCGHYCAGLCGEPCPSNCRQCNRREFEKIEKQLGIRLNLKSRFVILQPCSHLVEPNYMDDWVKRFEKQPPCYVDNSLILRCPICEDKVALCPRYNKVIKGAEWLLSEAKRRLAESNILKEKTTVSVECWFRSNEYSWSIDNELLGNGKGVRLRLGSICILYEIQCLLEKFANSLTVKYSKTLDKIGEQMVSGMPSYSKSLISGDIIILYRIYIEIQILRLEKLIRGPKLKTILRCKGRMESLPVLETAATDWLAIWKTIEKVNRSLTTELKRRDRMDDVDDYILFLNNFYDMELNASYMSQWMCCSKGHVFPNEEYLDKDMIDRRCPLCHPVHDYLLKNVHSSSAEDKGEKTWKHPAEDRTMRVNVLKDNNAKKSKTQPSTVQSTDTSNVATSGRKRLEYLSTSSESEQHMENVKCRERLGSDTNEIPKINELVPVASCQISGKEVVPFVREENVTDGRRDRMSELHTARRSSRKPNRRLHHDCKCNQRTSTTARDTDSQESSGINIRSNRERIDRITEKRSQSRDQFRSERDNSQFKHHNKTSTTKRSHRHTAHLTAFEPDSDWSPDYKRRRREEYAGFEHSQFQAEMTYWSWQDYSRHPRHSGRNERREKVLPGRDCDVEYRHHRTPPVQREVRNSEPIQRYHTNYVKPSYNGTPYRHVEEPNETYSGEVMNRRSNGYESTRSKHYPGHDRWSQGDGNRSERNMHTCNGGFTETDTDWSTQRIKPPDLREIINSQRVKRLTEEPTSTLRERLPDFDETLLRSSSSQAYDRPQVSYDEEYFDSLIVD